MLERAANGGTFLLNTPLAPGAVWEGLPRKVQQQIIDKQLKLHVIDAYGIARRNYYYALADRRSASPSSRSVARDWPRPTTSTASRPTAV